MPQDSSERNVLALFSSGGTFALLFSVLLNFISYSKAGEGPLDFSSPAIFLFANPSFLFASTMFLSGFLAIKLHLLPGSIASSNMRIVSGFILAVATYPIGLFFGLIISTLIPESFPYLPGIGLILSLVFVVTAAAATLRVITRRWPPTFWKGIPIFCLGVPFLTATIGYVSSPPGSRSLESSFGVKPVGGVPLLLFVAEIVLALLIGHWLYTGSSSNAPERG
jgi:hypothetical protein